MMYQRNDVCAIFYDNHEYNKLLPLTEKRSIASLPFDCKYRMIDFILSMFKNAKIHNIMMILNENKMAPLIDHIGSGREWGMDSAGDYSYFLFIQEILRKKSSGEMYFNMIIQYLEQSKSKYTVLIGNKFLCSLNLKNLIYNHISQQCKVTAAYHQIKDDKIAKDDKLLLLDYNHKIKGYIENDNRLAVTTSNDLSMEIFVMNTDWLIKILKIGQNEGITADLEKLIMDAMIKESNLGYEYTGFCANIHDIPSYFEANMKMLNTNDFNKLIYNFQKIKAHANRNVPTYLGKQAKISSSQLSSGCNIAGKVYRSLLSAKVNVKNAAVVEDSIVYSGVQIGEQAVVKNAILDKNVVIKDQVKVIGSKQAPIVISKGTVIENDQITSNEG